MKIAIINRSFWPVYPVVGEGLLRFAEKAASKKHTVSIILQDHVGIKSKLLESQRGDGITFYPLTALTTSASGVIFRVLDAIFFTFWVAGSLLRVRPSTIYISTDPPIIVPYIVMLYCKCSHAEYIYHLQDIHPEATKAVIPLNTAIFDALVYLDRTTMRKAKSIITINDQMAQEIKLRSQTSAIIHKINNPAISFEGVDTTITKKQGFSFCGNAGRLQRIPLLLSAIEEYFKRGGALEFAFAGGGIHAQDLQVCAEKFARFHYLGLISAHDAAVLNTRYTWALIPIEDNVTRFAFPSKGSTYVCSGAAILAICGEQTSVAEWVRKNRLGLVAKPDLESLISTFFEIERGLHQTARDETSAELLKEKLSFETFVEALEQIILE
jgi:hypothetical protein